MFDDLNRCLGWANGANIKNGLILIESESTDGGFLLHHFISLFLKRKLPVCLLTLAQTFSHYAQAGMKIGANLDKSKAEGTICHIDLMTIFMQKYPAQDDSSCDTFLKDGLKVIFHNIKQKIKELSLNQVTPAEKTLLVIDDLSIFVGFGFMPAEVQDFVHYLNILAKTDNILVVTVMPSFSCQNYKDVQLLTAHYAEKIIKLKSLPTGYSKDVHGHLELFDKTKPACSTTWQFKITDKNLQMFAKGTSSAVL